MAPPGFLPDNKKKPLGRAAPRRRQFVRISDATDATDNRVHGFRCYGFCFVELYNEERLHQSLDYRPPRAVYRGASKALASG